MLLGSHLFGIAFGVVGVPSDFSSAILEVGVEHRVVGLRVVVGSACAELLNQRAHIVEVLHIELGKVALLPVVTTVEDKLLGIDTVVVSIMHSEDFVIEEVRRYIREGVIAPVLKNYGFDIADVAHIHINPTGNFVIGGPNGDTGLTGRKIIVDTYGGYFSHGGGAFSGKDPTKVDRSAAYAARHVAKNIVAAGLASKCEIQLAYAIGVAQPVSLCVDTKGTGVVADDVLSAAVEKACASPVRRCTFPGADHAISFLVDDAGYTKAVTDFLQWVQQEGKRV